ncbi:MAG: hypothetical protein OEZ13_09040 [Spirochaetia bacterium]|nr:hypothetical protein [Spirochaetia bacterium]
MVYRQLLIIYLFSSFFLFIINCQSAQKKENRAPVETAKKPEKPKAPKEENIKTEGLNKEYGLEKKETEKKTEIIIIQDKENLRQTKTSNYEKQKESKEEKHISVKRSANLIKSLPQYNARNDAAIIFYSNNDTAKYHAFEMAEKIKARVFDLIGNNEDYFLKEISKKDANAINNISDFKNIKTLILCTPIYFYRPKTPLFTFINDHDFKDKEILLFFIFQSKINKFRYNIFLKTLLKKGVKSAIQTGISNYNEYFEMIDNELNYLKKDQFDLKIKNLFLENKKEQRE